jgi:hypothetical protein
MRPFDIVVYAIAAFALLLVFFGIYQIYFPQPNLSKEISGALELAQTPMYLGKTVRIGSRTIMNENTISKTEFEHGKISVAVECNSPDKCCPMKERCNGKIYWDYEGIEFKKAQSIEVNARCIMNETLPVCRIYFGELPAQAEMKKVELLENKSGNVKIKVTASNRSNKLLAFGVNSLKMYKGSGSQWVELDRNFDSQDVKLMPPNNDYNFQWEINFKISGTYKAAFKFEGENAGYDENFLIFDVDAGQDCKADADKPSKTFAMVGTEPQKFQEMRYCTGCSQAYECASAWEAEMQGKNFEPLSSEQTYCIKDSYEGAC